VVKTKRTIRIGKEREREKSSQVGQRAEMEVEEWGKEKNNN
jgi:hypothetical protein